jgi:apolipoprotein N-acyltransferase
MVAFPALLTLLEWLRERFLGGFPWLAPANTLLDTPLESWAPVAGPAGLNLVAGALAAALAMVMTPGARQRLLGAALIAILVGGGVLLDLPRWTSVGGAPFQIAVIQGNVAQDLKWRPEWRQRTLDTYQEMTHRAGPARLVLWPETAAPAYLDLLQGYTAPLAGLVAERGGALLMGAPTRDESGRSFNSLVVVGSKYGQYDKQHLVPFGEFIPLRRLVTLLGGLVQIPMSDFTPGGTDQPLLQAAGVELGASICFEVAFADEVRRALPEAELLVNVSNDAWFGNSLAPHQHLEMARLRALETGRFLVRATNTGISAIIGPDGNLRQRSAQFQAQILRGAVTPRTGSTPFVRWGQWPALLLGVALLLVLLISLRRSPN